MTEEQQGGTTPATDAAATVDTPTSDRPAGAIAVADEPAETTADATETPTEASTGGAARSDAEPAATSEAATVTDAAEPVADATEAATTSEPADDTPPATADIAETEPSAAETESSAAETEDAAAPPAAEAAPSAAADAEPSTAEAEPSTAEPGAAPEPPAPPRDLGPEPTTMEELLAEQESDIKSFKHGDVVEGTVVRIDKDEILVDIGAKSEGVVSNRELFGRHGGEGQAPLNIGDTVLVYVLQPESPEGHAVLSLRRAGLERKWRAMQEQFEAGVIIEAPVIDHNKGGLIVDCGIRGFVPISQIVD
ncbi:MAG TPA: S1 RNA-binding domain-containing protein, partial [Candidatus Limnocylindrales bacterium]